MAGKKTVDPVDVKEAAGKLILSASGWRKIFAPGGEESNGREITQADRIVVGAMALAFARAVTARRESASAVTAVATDSRPTGPSIADIIVRVLISTGIEVRFSGITAVPELLATVQRLPAIEAFAYVSASHNPVGYNGLKFGFADGAVAGGEASAALIASFKEIVGNTPVEVIDRLITEADPGKVASAYAGKEAWKRTTSQHYIAFTKLIAANTRDEARGDAMMERLRHASANRPTGVLADFNGSARAVSVDVEMLEDAGCAVETMNDVAGEIAHRIVPEGESLDPCRAMLEKLNRKNPIFRLGYVPDNDGDRGNIVYADETGAARTLHAQDVFALSCMSELAYLAYQAGETGEPAVDQKVVIVANGPTSMRVDRIASYFGARVERAEVGEANVVNLARSLRESGSTVRILGEGSAGGTIIHPAACRDPLNTLFSVLKLLLIPELFEIWCERSGRSGSFRKDFSLSDVLKTLPVFTTTGAYDDRAIMRIKTEEHGILKEKYERLFEQKWGELGALLKKNSFPAARWEIFNYEGILTRPGAGNRDKKGAQRGGLKVTLYDREDKPIAFLWMRGSGTEPVFRVLVDVEGDRQEIEGLLLNFHRELITQADLPG